MGRGGDRKQFSAARLCRLPFGPSAGPRAGSVTTGQLRFKLHLLIRAWWPHRTPPRSKQECQPWLPAEWGAWGTEVGWYLLSLLSARPGFRAPLVWRTEVDLHTVVEGGGRFAEPRARWWQPQAQQAGGTAPLPTPLVVLSTPLPPPTATWRLWASALSLSHSSGTTRRIPLNALAEVTEKLDSDTPRSHCPFPATVPHWFGQ